MHCACAILSSVACPTLQYFSTLFHKRYEFRGEKKVIEHQMWVLTFSTALSETFLILNRTERDMIINLPSLHVKYPLFLSDFNEI